MAYNEVMNHGKKDHMLNSTLNRLHDLLQTGKLRIALATMFSSLPGYFLYFRDGDGWEASVFLSLISGVILLSLAAGSLNNLQDSRIDRRTLRTANRPIPAGRLDAGTALIWTMLLFVSGLLILSVGVNSRTAIFGVMAIVIYNGIYTPLKRITSWAILPGATTGCIAPLMGYAAANGNWSPAIVWLTGFYFIWQIPHVFLIMLRHGVSYSAHDIPTLANYLTLESIARITGVWILALDLYMLMIPLFVHVPAHQISVMLFPALASVWMTEPSLSLWKRSFHADERRMDLNRIFMRVNLFPVIIGITLAAMGIFIDTAGNDFY